MLDAHSGEGSWTYRVCLLQNVRVDSGIFREEQLGLDADDFRDGFLREPDSVPLVGAVQTPALA